MVTPATAVPVQAPDTLVRGLPDFTGLVETVGPAVVNIRTNIKPKAAGPDTSIAPVLVPSPTGDAPTVKGAFVAQPGRFTVLIGASSRDIRARGELELAR